jgi:CBS domain containing-hemolysin-like protein
LLGLFVALLFIALNGLFVAAEFALVKVSATSLRSRARKGEKKAILAQAVVKRLDRYLSVTQFGITLASLGLGWIGEPAVEDQINRLATAVTGCEVHGPALHAVVVAISFTILTFAHVLLGELVPKLVAVQRSEGTALFMAAPLRLIYVVFRPLLWVLERASALILRGMGMSADAANEGKLSEEEILGILATNVARGPQGKAMSELVERVMRFSTRTARHAMVPRVDVFSLPLDTSGAEAREKLRVQQYSRVILTKGRSMDEVAGYLYAKDFLMDPEAEKLPNLWTLRRDVLFVPETQRLIDVMREMQKSQTPIAVVVDEYGGSSGLVTMEDLLEEIVGEIRDEMDEEPARVTKVPGEEAAWDVDARAQMQELRNLGVKVEDEEWPETVGTIVLARLGRLPRRGDRVKLGAGATAEITSVSRRRVTGVRVRIAQEGEGEATEASP